MVLSPRFQPGISHWATRDGSDAGGVAVDIVAVGSSMPLSFPADELRDDSDAGVKNNASNVRGRAKKRGGSAPQRVRPAPGPRSALGPGVLRIASSASRHYGRHAPAVTRENADL